MTKKYKIPKKYQKRTFSIYFLLIISIVIYFIFSDKVINIPFLFFLITLIINGIIFYRISNVAIAEIKDDNIYFFSGIVLSDPSHIELKKISSIKRISRRLLNIAYDNKILSFEGHKYILDELEKDLNNIPRIRNEERN
ncbi:MAG: hypothetical protein U9Q27_02205 [Patescibacteria group bacterium]|nr:hypothetical protein [Patescibacteria group bacterium]